MAVTISTYSGAEDVRVGVYVCHCGGNISDVVDVKKVVEAVEKHPNVVVARDYTFMCSDPGQNLIIDDIKENKINRVVVAACSPDLHELTFRKTLMRADLNPYLFEHICIREQNSWVHKSNKELATLKAIKLTLSGVAKLISSVELHPIKIQAEKQATVIGAGVAGLRSALALAKRGIQVSLIENTPFYGGRMAQLDNIYTTEEKARDLLTGLIQEVKRHPNIQTHLYTTIEDISGYIGNFTIQMKTHPRGAYASAKELVEAMDACPESTPNTFDYALNHRKAIYHPHPEVHPEEAAIDWNLCTQCGKCQEKVNDSNHIQLDEKPTSHTLKAGVIVFATGFDHYEPFHGEFGYGEIPHVVTLPQYIRLLDTLPESKDFEYQGKTIKNIAFIHCVGSRQQEGIHKPQEDGKVNDYCSRVCCTATLHAAHETKTRFKDMHVAELYKDIRAYGRGHEEYYEKASKDGVTFFRFPDDTLPEVTMNPTPNEPPYLVKVKDILTWNEEVEIPVDMVVLSSGMMPHVIKDLISMLKLPVGVDRFLQEVHPKLRPVELANQGIVVAGTVQGPMDINESCSAAEAAAVKAATLLASEHIELEPYVANVHPETCEGHGLCIKECAYEGAIALIEKEVKGAKKTIAQINEALCAGCGACVAVCPSRAIDLAGWTLDQIDAMVDAIADDTYVTGV